MFGTHEPKLYPLKKSIQTWGKSIRETVDPKGIRSDVESFPAPRNRMYNSEAMTLADNMILDKFTAAGWLAEKQPFTFDNVEGIKDISPSTTISAGLKIEDIYKVYDRLEGSNIIATKKGIDQSDKAIVIIGHHDTVKASPGANDNTASVAAIIELARILQPYKFSKSVILAMPDFEEIGFMGAKALVESFLNSYQLFGVINYETMGCVNKEPGSQIVPQGIDLLYKDQYKRMRDNESRGDFTCLIYNGKATGIVSLLGSALNYVTDNTTTICLRDPNDLPVIGKLLGILVPAVRNFARSDHSVFWKVGIPAFMVTDTANFRYEHYHQPTDTAEKVDYARIADIIAATAMVIAETAGLVQES